jgi:hypothetical protein
MVKKITLIIDAVINLILGVLLLAFKPHLSNDLGIPGSNTDFYPNILGGVFIGITLALIIETFRKKEKEWVGLGLIGAICINICGGLVLTLWLISGRLTLPLKGEIVLWALALVLLVISLLELLFSLKIIRRGSE